MARFVPFVLDLSFGKSAPRSPAPISTHPMPQYYSPRQQQEQEQQHPMQSMTPHISSSFYGYEPQKTTNSPRQMHFGTPEMHRAPCVGPGAGAGSFQPAGYQQTARLPLQPHHAPSTNGFYAGSGCVLASSQMASLAPPSPLPLPLSTPKLATYMVETDESEFDDATLIAQSQQAMYTSTQVLEQYTKLENDALRVMQEVETTALKYKACLGALTTNTLKFAQLCTDIKATVNDAEQKLVAIQAGDMSTLADDD